MNKNLAKVNKGDRFGFWEIVSDQPWYDPRKEARIVKCLCKSCNFTVRDIPLRCLRKKQSTKCVACNTANMRSVRKENIAKNPKPPHWKRIRKIWDGIKQRCYNPNNEAYERYGGAGIVLSEEFLDFKSFYDYVITLGYREDLTIDRINGAGLYERGNLRWCTDQEQCFNRGKWKNKESSRYKGVFKTKNGSFTVIIGHNNKLINLGTFSSENEAARKYNEKALELFGDKACPNEIDEENDVVSEWKPKGKVYRTGDVVGNWEIMDETLILIKSNQYLMCRCRCGNEKPVLLEQLRYTNPNKCRKCPPTT
jgi:hypothetical protein